MDTLRRRIWSALLAKPSDRVVPMHLLLVLIPWFVYQLSARGLEFVTLEPSDSVIGTQIEQIGSTLYGTVFLVDAVLLLIVGMWRRSSRITQSPGFRHPLVANSSTTGITTQRYRKSGPDRPSRSSTPTPMGVDSLTTRPSSSRGSPGVCWARMRGKCEPRHQ